jgi:diguanylate cyclase (GGDEF)-like protein/PAS domain S-box-containing protein
MLREVLEGKRLRFELEYPCHPPGGQRWFLARVSRIEGSRPAQVVVAHDDVTPLQQAKETLRRSEGLLLDLAASIPGALFRMARRCGGHWGFVYVSPGIETLYEVSPERACRDPAALRDRVLAEDLPGLYAAIRQAHSEGNALELEFRILTRSGQVKWIQAKARLKPGEDDQPMWTGVLTDISERKQMETALRDNEQTYRTLFETVPQGVIYQDAQGRITSGNPAASRILGLTLDQLQGRTSVDPRWRALHEDGSLFAGEDHPAMVALRTGRPVNGVVMGVAVPDRGYVWINVNATPLFGHGRLEQVYTTFEDITQRVLLSHELRQQASTDYLTGVANRRSLMERLNTEYRRIQRHPEVQCSVLALDLDHFKRVNDTWGHAAGDAMLVHLARLMRKGKRELDMVARSGGEEFTLLLPDTATDEAQAFADRLRRRVEDTPLQRGEHRIGITVSIGVSAMRSCDASADAVLVRADSALYEAKNAGRNAVRLS